MVMTEEKAQVNFDKFMAFVKADSRADQLIAMYEDFGDELSLAPASGKSYFHNAFPGGYLDHVVRVTETALQLSKVYKSIDGDIDFTKEELVFAALHHDLGKLGMPGAYPYYVDQDSDWHRKRGELYKQNEHLQYMKVPDRALMVLQSYGIKLTQKEWLGVKLSDGIYDDGAKSYLINYAPYAMKTSLPRIIHWADHMSSQSENDNSRF
jgi:hypothetical protein